MQSQSYISGHRKIVHNVGPKLMSVQVAATLSEKHSSLVQSAGPIDFLKSLVLSGTPGKDAEQLDEPDETKSSELSKETEKQVERKTSKTQKAVDESDEPKPDKSQEQPEEDSKAENKAIKSHTNQSKDTIQNEPSNSCIELEKDCANCPLCKVETSASSNCKNGCNNIAPSSLLPQSSEMIQINRKQKNVEKVSMFDFASQKEPVKNNDTNNPKKSACQKKDSLLKKIQTWYSNLSTTDKEEVMKCKYLEQVMNPETFDSQHIAEWQQSLGQEQNRKVEEALQMHTGSTKLTNNAALPAKPVLTTPFPAKLNAKLDKIGAMPGGLECMIQVMTMSPRILFPATDTPKFATATGEGAEAMATNLKKKIKMWAQGLSTSQQNALKELTYLEQVMQPSTFDQEELLAWFLSLSKEDQNAVNGAFPGVFTRSSPVHSDPVFQSPVVSIPFPEELNTELNNIGKTNGGTKHMIQIMTMSPRTLFEETKTPLKLQASAAMPYRFKKNDKVLFYKKGGWCTGSIVDVNSYEPDVKKDVAYKIKCSQNGKFYYAEDDEDDLVRKMPRSIALPEKQGAGTNLVSSSSGFFPEKKSPMPPRTKNMYVPIQAGMPPVAEFPLYASMPAQYGMATAPLTAMPTQYPTASFSNQNLVVPTSLPNARVATAVVPQNPLPMPIQNSMYAPLYAQNGKENLAVAPQNAPSMPTRNNMYLTSYPPSSLGN